MKNKKSISEIITTAIFTIMGVIILSYIFSTFNMDKIDKGERNYKITVFLSNGERSEVLVDFYFRKDKEENITYYIDGKEFVLSGDFIIEEVNK